MYEFPPTPNANSDPSKPSRLCPECGTAIFSVTPGKTSVEEIRAFARRMQWPEALRSEIERSGWLHPGYFCEKGCTQALCEFYPKLFLVDAGSRRQQVILLVKEILGVSLREAKDLVDHGEVVLVENRPERECFMIGSQFEAVGAAVRVGF
jgi:hypothetical protein